MQPSTTIWWCPNAFQILYEIWSLPWIAIVQRIRGVGTGMHEECRKRTMGVDIWVKDHYWSPKICSKTRKLVDDQSYFHKLTIFCEVIFSEFSGNVLHWLALQGTSRICIALHSWTRWCRAPSAPLLTNQNSEPGWQQPWNEPWTTAAKRYAGDGLSQSISNTKQTVWIQFFKLFFSIFF